MRCAHVVLICALATAPLMFVCVVSIAKQIHKGGLTSDHVDLLMEHVDWVKEEVHYHLAESGLVAAPEVDPADLPYLMWWRADAQVFDVNDLQPEHGKHSPRLKKLLHAPNGSIVVLNLTKFLSRMKERAQDKEKASGVKWIPKGKERPAQHQETVQHADDLSTEITRLQQKQHEMGQEEYHPGDELLVEDDDDDEDDNEDSQEDEIQVRRLSETMDEYDAESSSSFKKKPSSPKTEKDPLRILFWGGKRLNFDDSDFAAGPQSHIGDALRFVSPLAPGHISCADLHDPEDGETDQEDGAGGGSVDSCVMHDGCCHRVMDDHCHLCDSEGLQDNYEALVKLPNWLHQAGTHGDGDTRLVVTLDYLESALFSKGAELKATADDPGMFFDFIKTFPKLIVRGGRRIVDFDDHSMPLRTLGNDALKKPLTVFIVANSTSVDSAILDGARSRFEICVACYPSAAGRATMRVGTGGALKSVGECHPHAIRDGTSLHIFSAIFNHKESALFVDSFPEAEGPLSEGVLRGITMGGTFEGLSKFIGGIAEVIIIGEVLSTVQRNGVERHLREKYKIRSAWSHLEACPQQALERLSKLDVHDGSSIMAWRYTFLFLLFILWMTMFVVPIVALAWRFCGQKAKANEQPMKGLPFAHLLKDLQPGGNSVVVSKRSALTGAVALVGMLCTASIISVAAVMLFFVA